MKLNIIRAAATTISAILVITKPVAVGTNDIQETQEIIIETSATEETQESITFECLGNFICTGYCDCDICVGQYAGQMQTASGTTPTAGRTIAADLNILPYGTIVYIDGHAYTVEDKGGAIKGNHIDIYFNTHEEAVNFSIQQKEIYKRSDNE